MGHRLNACHYFCWANKNNTRRKFHVSLRPDSKLFCVNISQSIPFAYLDKLKDEIDLVLAQNIIMEVAEATEWCIPIVVIPKKNCGRICIFVDPSHLNKHLYVNATSHLRTPAQAVADIAASKVKIFTILNALKGYHQCPFGSAKSIPECIHYLVWEIQISQRTVWNFLHI